MSPDTGRPDASRHDPEMLDVEIRRGPHAGTGLVHLPADAADAAGAATAVLPGLEGAHRIPAGLAAGWLAALVALGPRARPDCSGQLVTDRATLDRLLDLPGRPSEQDARSVLRQPRLSDAWARALAAVAAPAGHWRLGPLEVVDGGAAGLWQVTPVDLDWLAGELDGAPPPAEPVALQPSDPSRVWAALTRLVRCPLPEAPG